MRGFGDYAEDGTASALKRRDYKDATDLIAEPHAIYSNESRCDNIPPAGLSHPLKIGSDGGGNPPCIAFTKSKRAQSTTDDETWVPGEVSPTMSCFDQGDTRATTVVAFTQNCRDEVRQINGDGQIAGALSADSGSHQTNYVATVFKPSHYTRGKDGAPSEVTAPLSADADKGDQDTVVAAPVQVQWASGGGQTENPTMQALRANAEYNYQFIRNAMAVRRLTPRECERLQGFPDDYTLVEYRKKPAADGPRYRALGNSMAVPVMRWIGERIQQVDRL
jgi:site-specific DNA-cytosine methylase